MSKLDNKLRQIPLVTLVKDNGSVWLSDKDINVIKQAIADEIRACEPEKMGTDMLLKRTRNKAISEYTDNMKQRNLL